MQHVKQKDGGDGTPFPPGALLRADSHRLLAGESSHCASAQAGGGRPSSMTGFKDLLEYVVVHEMLHLIEPSHSPRFIDLLDKHYPSWREARAELNELPLAAESWEPTR